MKLANISILYLLLPIVIFFVFWVRMEINIILLLVISYWLLGKTWRLIHPGMLRREVWAHIHPEMIRNILKFINLKSLFIILTIILWTLLSGAGHRGFFDGDYFKHNAVLSDLISYQWPVIYKVSEIKQPIYLVYYIAFYLPAALVGKLAGWKIAHIFLFGWTLLGVFLSFSWFAKFINKQISILMLVFFIFFSGLDIIGAIIFDPHFSKGINNIEWWNNIWQYSANTTLLFYVPQHALAGWIATGLIINNIKNKINIGVNFFIWSLTILWSPFVAVGLILFIIYQVLDTMFFDSTGSPGQAGFPSRSKQVSSNLSVLILSCLIIFVSGFYLLSNLTFVHTFYKTAGLIWQVEKFSHFFPRLLLFYFLEFGIFFLLISPPGWLRKYISYHPGGGKISGVIVLSIIILLLLPVYKYGGGNDFVMRVSIPALFILSTWIYKSIDLTKVKTNIFQFLLLIALLIGSITPILQLYYSSTHWSVGPPRFPLIIMIRPAAFAAQYLGKSDSIWGKYFARQQKPSIIKEKTAFSTKQSVPLNKKLNDF